MHSSRGIPASRPLTAIKALSALTTWQSPLRLQSQPGRRIYFVGGAGGGGEMTLQQLLGVGQSQEDRAPLPPGAARGTPVLGLATGRSLLATQAVRFPGHSSAAEGLRRNGAAHLDAQRLGMPAEVFPAGPSAKTLGERPAIPDCWCFTNGAQSQEGPIQTFCPTQGLSRRPPSPQKSARGGLEERNLPTSPSPANLLV